MMGTKRMKRMKRWPAVVTVVVLSATMVLASAPLVRAELCGDADDSGAVTVTDGVQTLRAAAGLGSSCTAARCDVDASDAITVTDGVNVLRAAAGLAVTLTCPGAGPACTAATVTVTLAVPEPVGAATLELAYPSAVTLPGSGEAAADRVTVANPGALLNDGQPNDLDDRVVFKLVALDGLENGELLVVRFDCLAPAPSAAAFTCTLARVKGIDAVTPVDGATCAVTITSE